jgi:hypothetical protein
MKPNLAALEALENDFAFGYSLARAMRESLNAPLAHTLHAQARDEAPIGKRHGPHFPNYPRITYKKKKSKLFNR